MNSNCILAISYSAYQFTFTFAIALVGSLARGEFCPFSDIEYVFLEGSDSGIKKKERVLLGLTLREEELVSSIQHLFFEPFL